MEAVASDTQEDRSKTTLFTMELSEKFIVADFTRAKLDDMVKLVDSPCVIPNDDEAETGLVQRSAARSSLIYMAAVATVALADMKCWIWTAKWMIMRRAI